MTHRTIAAVVALVFYGTAPIAAQTVTLEFHDGRVTLSARNVGLGAIVSG